ncbi:MULTISPECIES: glycosyltransferase [unclassified Vibrio]|uniref:glycosyltransferase n=1 Tax=unclassified Vibrio TaxID=2614977 RepID=UPI000B8EA383|nr:MULTISPECIES: glycosyltransferase [unclassified Vibrio]NAW98851.1 glycosyltransferase [Vibrio sp. V23_P3S9T160]OXX42440.1 glycosyl transferase [Vibrio sp. V11_P1A41T118]PRQ63742.1 glycosyl transferase [Vibrio sp. V01_P9A10T6]
MKIALLGNANSIHIRRWAEGLYSKGIEIHLVSCNPITEQYSEGIQLHQLTPYAPYGYIIAAVKLKRLLKRIRPDLLHAHYVSGYGSLAALSGYKNVMLSAWGADVYDFPGKSRFNHWLVKNNLQRARAIGTTSHCMLTVIKAITPVLPPIHVTPFGVDTNLFCPIDKNMDGPKPKVSIGTVKLLHKKYGIDTLIKAFAIVVSHCKDTELELVIVGNGPEEENLKRLASSLGVSRLVQFRGYIDNSLVPQILNALDIYVALSRLDSESFGVAAVEANACSLPVVVSDVSGFKEVVVDGKTGLIVERDNPEAAAQAICRLVVNERLREKMGKLGRQHVLENYSWDVSLDKMIDVYDELIE